MTGEAIGRLVRQIPIEEPMACSQALCNCRRGGPHARMVRGHYASQWQGEQAGVQPTTPQVFGERGYYGIPRLLQDGLTDVGRRPIPALDIAGEAEALR